MSEEFIEAYRDFPICNHVQGIGPENIGYSTGITSDGLPFEAEVYQYGKGENLQREISIIFPDLYVEDDDCDEYLTDDEEDEPAKVEGFSYKIQIRDCGVLSIGMVEEGQEDSIAIFQWYVDYIEDMGLVSFNSNVRSASVFYYTDVNGNDLVQVRIGLITNGLTEAETSLSLRDFPHRKTKTKNNTLLKLVK